MKTANEIKHFDAELAKAMAQQAEIISAMVNDWIYEDITLSLFGFVNMRETPQACEDQFDQMQDRGAKLNLVTGQYSKTPNHA